MARLGDNRWGKTDVRVSKVHRGDDSDDFSELTVQILLEGDVGAAHIEGDNSSVLPTDTMRNTVYGLAQEHLGRDLEAFGTVLASQFLQRPDVHRATVRISETLWDRVGPTGFIGGGSERRLAWIVMSPDGTTTRAGIEGLVVLKTTDSAFSGFPRDQFTVLPETEDRILSTSVTSSWLYSTLPADTTAVWGEARQAIVDGFFGAWSASVQHQGWLMAARVLDAVPEIAEVTFHLPNQHHLPFDLTRFGMEDSGIVFQPVSEPYGDIGLTVTR